MKRPLLDESTMNEMLRMKNSGSTTKQITRWARKNGVKDPRTGRNMTEKQIYMCVWHHKNRLANKAATEEMVTPEAKQEAVNKLNNLGFTEKKKYSPENRGVIIDFLVSNSRISPEVKVGMIQDIM